MGDAETDGQIDHTPFDKESALALREMLRNIEPSTYRRKVAIVKALLPSTAQIAANGEFERSRALWSGYAKQAAMIVVTVVASALFIADHSQHRNSNPGPYAPLPGEAPRAYAFLPVDRTPQTPSQSPTTQIDALKLGRHPNRTIPEVQLAMPTGTANERTIVAAGETQVPQVADAPNNVFGPPNLVIEQSSGRFAETRSNNPLARVADQQDASLLGGNSSLRFQEQAVAELRSTSPDRMAAAINSNRR